MSKKKLESVGTNLPAEIFIAFLTESATIVVTIWVGSTNDSWPVTLAIGTLFAVLVAASPAFGFRPLGFRAYKSRFLTTSPEITSSNSANGDRVIGTGGGVAAGRGGIAIGRDVKGNISIYNSSGLGSIGELLVTSLLWLIAAISLLITAIPVLALVIVFGDLTIIVLPILLVLAASLIPFNSPNFVKWLSARLLIPEGVVAIIAQNIQSASRFMKYLLSTVMILFIVGGFGLGFSFMRSMGWEPLAILFTFGPGMDPPQSLEDPGVAYIQDGLYYERRGDYENAITSYRKEIEIHPQNAAAYNALAWLYADKLKINLDEAIQLAQTAVALTENKEHISRDYWLANYLDTLGWAYYQNGNYADAVVTLERSVALDNREDYRAHLEAARTAINNPP